MGEEKGTEGDVPGVWKRVGEGRRDRTRIVALANGREKEEENLERERGGDKTGARGGEIARGTKTGRCCRSSHVYVHASTYTFTGSSSSRATDCQRDSHYELLEKSIEYKKSPWCVRRVGSLSPPRPSSFPSLSSSPSFSFYHPLSSTALPAPLATSLSRARARARYPCLLATKRG